MGSRGSIPLESPLLPTTGWWWWDAGRVRSPASDFSATSSLPPTITRNCPLATFCEPSQALRAVPPPTLTCALGPHPLLRRQQVSSEDVVIDTFATEPQGKGALDEDRTDWVVAGQRCLLIRTLDSWYGNMPGGPWLRVSVQRPRGPPSRPGKKPAAPCTGPYLQCVAWWDPLYLWSLWMKASEGKSGGGSW